MPEEIAKKKRVRRVLRAAILKITIERVETVWKPTREWKQVRNEATPARGCYEYVDAVLPREEKTLLLEQSLPESKLDLAKVIKAINGL